MVFCFRFLCLLNMDNINKSCGGVGARYSLLLYIRGGFEYTGLTLPVGQGMAQFPIAPKGIRSKLIFSTWTKQFLSLLTYGVMIIK